MMRMSLVLIVLCLLCLTYVASATELKVDVEPPSQEILIGDSGSYNITVSCSVELDTGNHNLTITCYDENNSLTDKLYCEVSFVSAPSGVNASQVNLAETLRDASSVTYSWCAPSAGDYVFELVVSFNRSSEEQVQVGEQFIIVVSDNKADTIIQASATVYATAIPELLTSMLVGAGVLTIGYLTTRKL